MYSKFKSLIVLKGMKNYEVAKILGIKASAFSLKINRRNGRDFSTKEIRKLCDFFKVSADEYFFNIFVDV